MADCKELGINHSQWSPEFIQELLPSAERTALLYHLSYLCLGGFPKLEQLIREQATETQLLFGSSEEVLLKCTGTASNLVNSLFPILKKAVETNKPVLALIFLELAKTWIRDIITALDDMVQRYDQHNKTVAKCTSDVFEEQKETKDKLAKHSDEIKGLEDALKNLEAELRKNAADMTETGKKIEETNKELQEISRKYEEKQRRPWILIRCAPSFVNYQNAGVAAIKDKRHHLSLEMFSQQKKDCDIKVKQTDLQQKLATSKIRMGEIPSPVHLMQVHQCLFQIQQVMVDLKKFWEKVGVTLETLRDRTFVGEHCIVLGDLKDVFLASIEDAGKYWQRFGACSQRAQSIFSVQSKDAYKFLEINPSTLSEEERNKQYMSVMEKLKRISPHGSSTAAITE